MTLQPLFSLGITGMHSVYHAGLKLSGAEPCNVCSIAGSLLSIYMCDLLHVRCPGLQAHACSICKGAKHVCSNGSNPFLHGKLHWLIKSHDSCILTRLTLVNETQFECGLSPKETGPVSGGCIVSIKVEPQGLRSVLQQVLEPQASAQHTSIAEYLVRGVLWPKLKECKSHGGSLFTCLSVSGWESKSAAQYVTSAHDVRGVSVIF